MDKPLIWAHRGASNLAPENSMEAFSLAVEMKADGIELDVHLTSDGEIIVTHDETVNRCSNGKGLIADMTLEEIKRLDFSCNMEKYKNVKAPTLAEVYELIRPTGLTVNVELKHGSKTYVGLEKKCAVLAREMGMRDKVIYSSFNHNIFLELKEAEPSARFAPLYMEALVAPWQYALQIQAYAIHPYFPTMETPGIMEGLQEAGVLCNPWTVDTEDMLEWMAKLGVNAVITNRVDLAKKVFYGTPEG